MEGKSVKPRLSIRRIALPAEHGSWGILLEPLIASLAVAPSSAGFLIAIGVAGAFLMRQPLRVFATGVSSGTSSPNNRPAAYFCLFFGLVGAAGFSGAAFIASAEDLLPLLALVPFGIYQVFNDVSRKSRELLPELAGAAALSASAPSIALAAGWGPSRAAALWVLFVARSIPSFVYVRQRLRLEKGKDFVKAPPVMLHGAALALSAGLAVLGLTPYLPIAVYAFLFWRAVTGLSDGRTRLKAVQLGIRETAYGGLLALSIILGHYLGL